MNPPLPSGRIPRLRSDLGMLGFGAASLGNVYAAVPEEQARDAILSALDCGMRYFDTAPLYGHGLSEIRLGRALNEVARDRFMVSTKVGRLLVADPAMPASFGGYVDIPAYRPVFDYSAEGAYRSIADSLDRLGLDRVDIAYIHDIDLRTHGEAQAACFRDAMEGSYLALERLRAEGALRYIGIGVNETQVCLDAARAGDFDLFLLASRYTLIEQEPLDALFPLCLERGIGVVIGGPYSTGILASGAVEGARFNYRPAPPRILARVAAIEEVCRGFGVALPAAALRFAAAHPAVVSVIPGARSEAEVRQNDALMKAAIPAAFWDELKDRELIRRDAPTG